MWLVVIFVVVLVKHETKMIMMMMMMMMTSACSRTEGCGGTRNITFLRLAQWGRGAGGAFEALY